MKNPRSRRWTGPPHAAVAAGLAARRAHDCKRHGTTTLLAALEVATGKITADAFYPRHRHPGIPAVPDESRRRASRHGPARRARQLRHPQLTASQNYSR